MVLGLYLLMAALLADAITYLTMEEHGRMEQISLVHRRPPRLDLPSSCRPA